MTGSRTSAAASRRLLPLCLALAAALIALLCLPRPAAADCTNGGGALCLPGSGYVNTDDWNCGPIGAGVNCYYDGRTDFAFATWQTFGWAQASYDGVGSPFVCTLAERPRSVAFYACGSSLARGCYHANCNDQNAELLFVHVVKQDPPGAHTIRGLAQW